MPGRRSRLPKKGDKKLSAEFLRELSERLDRFDKLTTGNLPLSTGPAGIAIPFFEPDSTKGMKLVYYDYLPPAWGGIGRHNTTELSISLGNYIPPPSGPDATINDDCTPYRRRMYRRTCNQWRFERQTDDGNGYITNNVNQSPNLLVFNPFDLPLIKGFAWVQPLAPEDPEDLHYVVVQPVGPNPWGAVHCVWNVISNAARVFEHDGGRLLNGTMYETSQIFPGASGNLQQNERFVFRHNGDLMLPYPGFYKITWGAEVIDSSSSFVGYETSGPNGSPAPVLYHTHNILNNFSSWLETEIQLNRQAGPISINSSTTSELRLNINLEMKSSNHASAGGVLAGRNEKTVIIANDPLASHGGAYTRISFACKARFNQLNPRFNPFDSLGRYTPELNYMNIGKAWVVVEPVSNQAGSFGGGANCYPNGYNQFNSEDFPRQWWGGGSQPPMFNELTGEEL